MNYVIGDIHGEVTKIKSLINNISKIDKDPSYIFIGDYLDKGEDAFKTLSFLTTLSKNNKCTFLYGNHEYIWLNLHEDDEENQSYLLKYGGEETIRSFACKSIWDTQKKLFDTYGSFFKSLVSYWKNEEFVVVHSGINPEDYNKPINDLHVKDLLFNRYEFIGVNSLYLKRFKIIFGHTAFYSPYYDGYKLGIDSGACFLPGQPITSFCIEKQFFIDSNNLQYSLQTLDINQCPTIIRSQPWRSK